MLQTGQEKIFIAFYLLMNMTAGGPTVPVPGVMETPGVVALLLLLPECVA
jgi:hypothetical protein